MKAFGPYSPIRRAGSHYYVSGQLGIDPTSKQAASDIEGQTNQTMKNLGELLKSKNLTFSHLAKTTIYLKNIEDFSKVNELYESFFNPDEPKPTRACVEVSNLPNAADKQLLIEIEAVAYKE